MREVTLGGLRTRLVGGDDGDGGGTGPLVVLLHGYGAPGTDLVPLWQALEGPTGTRFAFPEAPISLGMGFFGDSRAWWEIDVQRLEAALAAGTFRDMSEEVPENLPAVRTAVGELLDELGGTGGGAPVVLGGFSQGAMLSIDVALRREQPLAALVVLSGTIIAEPEWTPLFGQLAQVPVFQSHGSEDPLLPFSVAERLRDLLGSDRDGGDWVPFRGAHEIPAPVLERLRTFVAGVLA